MRRICLNNNIYGYWCIKGGHSTRERVAITPNVISKINKLGYKVLVERGLGLDASFSDLEYQNSGAVVSDANDIWSCDIILKINKPNQMKSINCRKIRR